MIIFDRKLLIQSQNDKLERIYRDVNFFVCLGFILITIMVTVVMYFFSIVAGLWVEAVVIFCCSMYYMIMSFVRERMALGYYQKAKQIIVNYTKNGLVVKEVTKESEKDYLVAYNDIHRILEYKAYFVIMMKNEGKITLPNIVEADELKEQLKTQIGNAYLVVEN